MSVAAEKIEEEFKKLAPDEQAALVEKLGNMVYGDEENPAFVATLERRVAEIESGAVTGRDAFEVIDEIKAKHIR